MYPVHHEQDVVVAETMHQNSKMMIQQNDLLAFQKSPFEKKFHEILSAPLKVDVNDRIVVEYPLHQN